MEVYVGAGSNPPWRNGRGPRGLHSDRSMEGGFQTRPTVTAQLRSRHSQRDNRNEKALDRIALHRE